MLRTRHAAKAVRALSQTSRHQARDIPASTFNTANVEDRSHVQPLANAGAPEMDESFVGKTGGGIFHEMMLRHNVKHIFGYPGGAILPVYDAIYNSKHFDFILPKHEQGAGHMAQGYARASGKPGVVLVTSGPGATNVVTPPGGGRPVLVDLPKDVTASLLRKAIPTTSAIPGLPSAASRSLIEATNRQLQASLARVGELINTAKRPVIYAGHGIITSENGPELLKALADKASIPVTTTLHGLGAFDELDEKSLYMLGMHGSAFANMAMQEVDLIIALGSRFDDRVTLNISKFAPAAKAAAAEGRGGIVHFEIMPKNINKVVQATEAIEGDVSKNLAQLLPHVKVTSMTDRKEWFDNIKAWKEKWPMNAFERTERPGMIKPQVLIEHLSNLTADRKRNTIITTGVGQHQMWTAQHFRWRHPRTMITSGGLGTMGYGLPAAISAKVARPDALVIDIDGDASFNMTLTELSTAAQFNIGVKVIVLNNEEQGMLADAMGVQHRRLIKPEDTQECLQWLIETDGPAFLEVMTDKKVPVLPMVPTGADLHEFLVWDGEKDKKRRELMRSRTGGLHG
ncbi:hypothetical protein CIB48_g3569 [Xylaria polymorpha]|nr:hypothetical protein CIB48_g3569 [Xylaria polymorpha]